MLFNCASSPESLVFLKCYKSRSCVLQSSTCLLPNPPFLQSLPSRLHESKSIMIGVSPSIIRFDGFRPLWVRPRLCRGLVFLLMPCRQRFSSKGASTFSLWERVSTVLCLNVDDLSISRRFRLPRKGDRQDVGTLGNLHTERGSVAPDRNSEAVGWVLK